MEVFNSSNEPEWLEREVVGHLRTWHIIFLCLGGITSLGKLSQIKNILRC